MQSLAWQLGCFIDAQNFRTHFAAEASAAFIAAGLITRRSDGYELNVPTPEALLLQTHSPNSHLRGCAATALGAYGIEGRPMIPRLVEMQSDPDEHVQSAAKHAVDELKKLSDP